jgi:hypothetical protein
MLQFDTVGVEGLLSQENFHPSDPLVPLEPCMRYNSFSFIPCLRSYFTLGYRFILGLIRLGGDDVQSCYGYCLIVLVFKVKSVLY